MIPLPTNNNVSDKLLKVASWLGSLLILFFFIALITDVIVHGISRIDIDFFLNSPENAGRLGGIAPMLLSTMLLLVLCLIFALPIGIGSAIYLAEYTNSHHWFVKLIRKSLNVLASVPSIVMGLFGYAFFVITLDFGFSILSGALTLSVMVLPLLIRNIEDSLRNISKEFRHNAFALGLSKTTTIFKVLLPMATQGIILATILSIARAMAETAALLYTSGYVTRMPESVFDSGRSLSVHIFDLSMNVPGGEPSAYASTLTLILLLLSINIITQYLSHIFLNRASSL